MNSDFGRYIRSRRLEKSLSLSEASERMNLSLSYLERIENGDPSVSPSEKEMESIASVLEEETWRLYNMAGRNGARSQNCVIECFPEITEQFPESGRPVASLFFPSFRIFVGWSCPSRCPFCFVPADSRGYLPFEELAGIVERAAVWGRGRCFFTGGEPSLYPNLAKIIERGRKAGITSFGMATNGWGLVDSRPVQELNKLGLNVYHLSWFGQNTRRYSPGRPALEDVLESLHSVQGNRIVIYIVLFRDNRLECHEMIEEVVRLRKSFPDISGVVFALVRPEGRAALRARTVLFPYEEAVPSVRQAIELADREKLPLMLNHFPACLLPDMPNATITSRIPVVLRNVNGEQVNSSALAGSCTPAGGELCIHMNSCIGYHEKYVELFGSGIFKPSGGLLRHS